MTYRGPERRKKWRPSKPPCKRCQSDQSEIHDSGCEWVKAPEGVYVRQRRCLDCGYLWLTFEQNSELTPYVVVTDRDSPSTL